MEEHGKLSQNDVDETDTDVSLDKREIMIRLFCEIPKLWRARQPKFQIAERRLFNVMASRSTFGITTIVFFLVLFF